MRGLLLTCLLWAGALAVLPAPGWAQDGSVDTIDREIIERLDRIETRLDGLDTRLTRVETRLDGLEGRLDEGLKRLEGSIKQLREDISSRLDSFLFIFIGVIGFIGVIIAALIGVLVRDRRTPPLSAQPEHDSLENIRAALHALAQRDENVAAVLKQFNL